MVGYVDRGRAIARGAAFALLCCLTGQSPRALARALDGVAPFEGTEPCRRL